MNKINMDETDGNEAESKTKEERKEDTR